MSIIKRIIAIIISICVATASLLNNTNALGTETTTGQYCNKNVNIQYSGIIRDEISQRNCVFRITHITDNTFYGHIFIQSSLLFPEVDVDVSGSITYTINTYSCSTNINNTATFDITITPFLGTATATLTGLAIFYSNFTLTGTVDKFYAQYFPYNDEDMKTCAFLSSLAYEDYKDNELILHQSSLIPKRLLNTLLSRFNTITSYNYEDSNNISYTNAMFEEAKNNVAYTVTNRINLDGTIDIFVIVRGTLDDEWMGNVQLTGSSYIQSEWRHDNFYKAAESIKEGINDYYNNISNTFSENSINLIITGHSRGAAVANIYAAQAIDFKGGNNSIQGIPRFNNVTAYTFACPNIGSGLNVKNNYYGSIFNFNLDEDIVPSVPLTNPTTGWGYWKFGRSYYMPASGQELLVGQLLLFLNSDTKGLVLNSLKPWPTVYDYYNKNIESMLLGNQTTLYNTLYSVIGSLKSNNLLTKVTSFKSAIKEFGFYNELIPLLKTIATNIPSIVIAHSANTYNKIINGNNSYAGLGSQGFRLVTYDDIANSTELRNSNESRSQSREGNITYNTSEVLKLTTFANSNDNNDILEWDLTDPSSWEGVTWDSNGNVSEIDFTYKWLQGTLDVSGFTSLTKLKVYANTLSSINIDNCTALTSLDCSYNPLASGLDLEDCTALTELYCDGCGLNTLDISDLEDLEKLSCSFNNLTVLDFSSNTELEHLVCCYNYLDTHRGGALHTALLALRGGGVYVNYYPQAVPDNATFNTAELNALKAFALSNDNNDVLDWLDENDNIDTDKLQNNVLFEYDGTEYRVVAIDIAETEVTGSLNLSALTKLEELYCERTGLTSLNVNGCASLEVLSCYGCEIETLTLPSNITSTESPLYNLDCEYNYIDTTMFTQAIIDNISSKDDYVLEYENQKWEDGSALAAVIEFSQGLNGNDYSESSFSVLSDLIDSYEDYENYLLTQDDIDEITAEFLTAISDLEPYLKLKLSGDNGTVTTVYNGETQNGSTHSILFGESVTLTATPDENYTFDGWYERITQRVYSTDSTYTFPMTTNLDFVARFVKQNAAILSFTNDTGQIVSKIDNTPTEWNDVTTLDDLLPDVPYKLGHVNGRWNYIESEVLTALRAGTDVTITPVYDATDYVYPEAPLPVNGNPVLNLTFTYDETNDIGSFIMGAGLPQNLDIESMGIAFYLKNKNTFVPDNYILNINNKAVVSRFDSTVPDNRYIVNVHRFAEKYNWCARGFVTYRDDGALKIAYSNQMNITNTVQNNRRIAISRSVEFSHNIDTIVDDDE